MIAFNVLLTKVESTHNNLRTTQVEGQTLTLPEIGKEFSMVGASLTEGLSHRWINTTEIKEVQKTDEEITFKTQNSTYKLKVLGTEEVK